MKLGSGLTSWILKVFRRHPILGTVMAVYLALSAAELTRILLYDGPRVYDAGLHAWEQAPDGDQQRRFRWTNGEEAYLLRPVVGTVLSVRTTLQRPDMPGPVVPVELSLADRPLGRMLLDENEWLVESYYLPPVLGPQRWSRVVEGWEELEPYADPDQELTRYRAQWYEELGPSPRRFELINALWEQEQVPDYKRVFTEWHPPPGPPSEWIRVEVPDTAVFVPAEVVDTDDDRELGVGVAELGWANVHPEGGLGFYPWETDEAGIRYRWSRQRASTPVTLTGPSRLSFRVRADHPELEESPVEVTFFWGDEPVESLSLGEPGWQSVEFDVVPHSADESSPAAPLDVLSLFVSRTWNPYLRNLRLPDDSKATVGDPNDTRYLGIAVTEVRVKNR